MVRRLAQWARGEGFSGIRADWLKRAAGLGEAIRVRLPEREFSGRFEGLDEAGRLLVDGPAGVTAVTAGEVFGMGGR
jgi:BirA family biotin operon repressor/biotin-[acetyl-CoA-carboxylase] ligase